MREGEYNPSPKEIREAEESMRPSEGAMTRARFDVMSHAPDLQNAGVTSEQIEQAATFASERAKLEFEQKEKEDPYRRIAEVINNAAETQEEKELAISMISRLEQHRTQAIHEAQKVDAMEKVGADLGEALVGHISSKPGWVERDGKFQSNSTMIPYDEEPPKIFVERVLRGLGAIEPNQSLDSLSKSLPDTPNPEHAHYDSYFKMARNLSSSMNGVRLDIRENGDAFSVRMNMDRVRQIIHFPESE